MYRNDDPTTVSTAPSVPTGAGLTPGFFTNGNPTTGQAATIVPDWWLTQLQEEPLAVLAAANIAAVKGSNNQLLTSLYVLFGGKGDLDATLGWMQLPGSLILQWGTGTSGTNGQTPVTLPKQYPSVQILAHASEQNAAGWAPPAGATSGVPSVHGCYSKTTEGFMIYSQEWSGSAWIGGSGIAYGWISIGF